MAVPVKEKKKDLRFELNNFFKKLVKSNIVFITQAKPVGFGDAIQYGEKFTTDDYFLLHAGDDIVISKENRHLERLENSFKKYKADIACLIEEVENPSQYGVVSGAILENGVIDIKKIVEKPKKPKSKNAVIAIYIFKPKIFNYLSQVKKKSSAQNQLSDAFDMALKKGDRMIGVILNKNEKRIDIGTPETYSKLLVSLK